MVACGASHENPSHALMLSCFPAIIQIPKQIQIQMQMRVQIQIQIQIQIQAIKNQMQIPTQIPNDDSYKDSYTESYTAYPYIAVRFLCWDNYLTACFSQREER